MSRLKLGVIGAGTWGRNHVRAAAGLPEAELAAVCDTDAKTRDRLAPQYPAVYFTAEAADLLGRVDAAIIAAPAAIHARLALQCIEAGKPCLVEKPFALRVEDAETVACAAADRAVPVLAGHAGDCRQGCDHALENALITAPEHRDPALLAKLDAVAGRVLKQ